MATIYHGDVRVDLDLMQPTSPELQQLLEEAKARVAAMSPEELAEMYRQQSESWARAMEPTGDPKFD